MGGLTMIIETIGSDPRVWYVLGLFGAVAAFSLVRFFYCPIMHGRSDLTAEQAKRETRKPIRHNLRFAGVMIVGIVLAIFGLFKLANPDAPPAAALFFLVLGVYLFTTEPTRMEINDAENHYVATGGVGEPAALAMDTLRTAHVRLLGFELGLVALLLVGVLAI